MRDRDPLVTHVSLRVSGPFPYVLGIVSIVWLPFGLSTAINDLLSSHLKSPHYIAMAIGATLFLCIYLWGIYGNVRHLVTTAPPLKRIKASAWLTIAILTVLSIIMVWLSEKDWASLFIFVCAYASGRLPTVPAVWTATGILLYPIIGTLTQGLSWPELGSALFLIGVVSFMTITMVRSYRTSQELRAAREEIAHLAVTTERLRIARDLHDLLGHNLSLIALKSELARRMINKDVERATTEISDIEQAARTMLQEVREAVGSYRQPTLSSELHRAQEILAAAGIAYHYEGDENIMDDLPNALEAVFAWTVREGVTNIIRHSRAHQCVIRMARTRHEGSVEIINDGAGIANPVQDSAFTQWAGNGLRGLTERVEALGGQFNAGFDVSGGFRLAAMIPLVQKTEKPGIVTIASVRPTPSASRQLSDHKEGNELL